MNQLKSRRAELLAESFLTALNPKFIAKTPASDVPYDYLVGVAGKNGSVQTIAVEVKKTEGPLKRYNFKKYNEVAMARKTNLPVMMLVADIKHNDVYLNWMDASRIKPGAKTFELAVEKTDAASAREFVSRRTDGKAGSFTAKQSTARKQSKSGFAGEVRQRRGFAASRAST